MTTLNEHLGKLKAGYLFPEIGRRTKEFQAEHPDAKIIRLGIGDATERVPQVAIEAAKKAWDELGNPGTFKGYCDEQGYPWLRNAIADRYYGAIAPDEVFVSDGAKCDVGNIQEIFGSDNLVAVQDPVYPVYVDTNVMAGRTGPGILDADGKFTGAFNRVVYMPCTSENGFVPEVPERKVDLLYLCSPNNPTGAVLTRETLQRFVDYAIENKTVIIFDAAYAKFISDPHLPKTIYEIQGARKCAIESNSFSKEAGFTGVRVAWTVVPKDLETVLSFKNDSGAVITAHDAWNRRTLTKFNGVAYPNQRAAEAVLTPEGQQQAQQIINFYMENARIIQQGLDAAGISHFGSRNAPYVWMQTPNGMDSWQFFDKLLQEANVVGTPGVGFGPSGQGYFRLSSFGHRENVEEAVERFKRLNL